MSLSNGVFIPQLRELLLEAWIPLIWTLAALVALWLVSRWISKHIQALGWLIAGDADGAVVALWIVLLPGIMLHEWSHWLVAKVLGMAVKPPDLYPRRRGKHIRLGSVTVTSGGHLLDSLVGLAPFLFGGLAILILGSTVFDLASIVAGVDAQGWQGAWDGVLATLRVQDAWIWLYLIFAISNSMFPSPSDSEPVRPVLLFGGLLAGLALIAGWNPSLSTDTVNRANQVLLVLAQAFTFTLVVDLFCGVIILVLEHIVGAIKGQRVVFENSKESESRKRRT